jgi:hypothetical protein
MQGLSSLTAQTPRWVAILAALVGVVTGLLTACAPTIRAWFERKKVPADIHLSEAQTEKTKAEAGVLRVFGSPDGSLIERLGEAVDKAYIRLDKQEQVIFEQADHIKRLDDESKESKRLHDLCETEVAGLKEEVRRLKG